MVKKKNGVRGPQQGSPIDRMGEGGYTPSPRGTPGGVPREGYPPESLTGSAISVYGWGKGICRFFYVFYTYLGCFFSGVLLVYMPPCGVTSLKN